MTGEGVAGGTPRRGGRVVFDRIDTRGETSPLTKNKIIFLAHHFHIYLSS